MPLLLESIGKCEYCGEVFSTGGIPEDSTNTVWVCPECKEELTYASFGFEESLGVWKRVRWVGEDGKWTETRPEKSFYLDGTFILPDLPPLPEGA